MSVSADLERSGDLPIGWVNGSGHRFAKDLTKRLPGKLHAWIPHQSISIQNSEEPLNQKGSSNDKPFLLYIKIRD